MHVQGMDCVRINTAYGDVDYYDTIVNCVHEVADMPIIVDVKGPEIRIRAKTKREVRKDDRLLIGFRDEEISFNYDFYDEVDIRDKVLIDNGKIVTEVISKGGNVLQLLVHNDGIIDDRKGVNIPRKKLSVPSLSPRDMKAIEFAIHHNCEYIALSFTRGPWDIDNLRRVAKEYQGAIIAKIENFEGVENFEHILNIADGLMVARGDLGVEIEPERVPLIQKWMITLCNKAGKTVIVATDMLESMIDNPTPTRSEASDAANAILDGTDAVMLSGETAIGKYPIEAVTMMQRIALEVEKAVVSQVEHTTFKNISETVSHSIQRIANDMPLDKIVTLTRSGYTARMISRFKLKQDIIAVTPSNLVKNQLKIAYGVTPVQMNYLLKKDRILSVAQSLYSKGLIQDEDNVLFTAAFRTVQKHSSNLIEIHKIKELLQLI
jgi:pyruvate kinase